MTDFSLLIIEWYRLNHRNLPWRNTKNPYKIWLSEVILQQTRVDQGLKYYHNFIDRFPTIADLAAADEQEVLKLWQGLGYYSRARNLHFAANQVLNDYSGKFPTDYDAIKSLKGIGDYTAAAIASFAFDLVFPVVDGNVLRVLSRFYGDATPIDISKGKKLFTAYAVALIDEKQPANFNQAIMELGAMVCTPQQPKCEQCPLKNKCISFQTQTQKQFPCKSKKVKVKDRYFYYLVYPSHSLQLEKRAKKDIWMNLYQFPLVECLQKTADFNEIANILHKKVKIKREIASVTHVLSHQRLHATFLEIDRPIENESYQSVKFKDIEYYPLPRLIDRFIEENVQLFT